MSNQKFIDKMTGYKATNADMSCTPNGVRFQFELGKWYEHEGDVKLCGAGFHFCVHPSGPWSYYSAPGTRIFKVEAEQVLEIPVEAGADFKFVAKRIRLAKEITPGGNRNTGGWNTGDSNTGGWNTGDRNTGDRNTGDSNTGDSNTGDWNATNNCAGFFCQKEPKVISFDIQTSLTRREFFEKYPEVNDLGAALHNREKINFEYFKNIPGITPKKLKSLHEKHLAAKK